MSSTAPRCSIVSALAPAKSNAKPLPHNGHALTRVMKDVIGAGRCFPALPQLYQRTRHVLMAHQERPI